MNVTIIVAASSLMLACLAFAFFYLTGGSDKSFGRSSGTISFSGAGVDYDMKYQVGDDGMSITIFIEDGTHSALWVKTAKDGEFEGEEIFLNDAAAYQVVEFENDVATSCRVNTGRDQERINKMISSISYDGGSDTYSVTEDGFDGSPVTISVTFSEEETTLPQFDWSTCKSIGDPVDPFVEGDSRKVLESIVEVERALGFTDAGNLALDAYDQGTCVDASSVFGDFLGKACYLKREEEPCSFGFRGSDDNADWADNILGAYKTEFYNGAKIHAGFYNQLKTLIKNSDIEKEVGLCENPIFVGHSLGGALANVAHTYWDKGEINTYAGPGPYSGGRSEPCTKEYQSCRWTEEKSGKGKKKRVQKCITKSRLDTCTKSHHVTGKRTYHEYDPVPYATNLAGYDHGGGIGYRIQWECDCWNPWYCPFDWGCNDGRWVSKHIGTTNEPTADVFSTLSDIAQNIYSYATNDGAHYHSMSVHYKPYAQ
ncbi:hypothetical protein TrLO_g3223 [Triparma laevis f. longispina]|uniref:Fungal lipase-type domain-containing protein n=1 Tax=Triparma laevis f. longispina TaxID=1714387 RepID=A0A9W6ZYC4_9STRA|nr:hypothetical protein TrLO_g3223 [Triparma laevis f. longispina]